MSRIATDWAWRQPLRTSLKLVLLSLSDRAGEHHECYPSIDRLCADTGLNRKTVISSIDKLEDMNLLKDTGERKGKTGRVKVYQIVGITEQYQKRNDSKKCMGNSPKNGTLNSPKSGTQNLPLESPIRTKEHTSSSQAKNDKFAEQIKEVFQHWKSTMGKDGKVKLTKKRESAVRARLSDGFSVAELCKAIDGCKVSPYHQGDNPAGTVYDDLELICRDDVRVNRLAGIKDSRGKPQSRTVDPCAGQKFESRINPELLKPREQHNEQGN